MKQGVSYANILKKYGSIRNCHDAMKGYHISHPDRIDKNILGLVNELNRLGFTTVSCCEGHSDTASAYIAFTTDVPEVALLNLLQGRCGLEFGGLSRVKENRYNQVISIVAQNFSYTQECGVHIELILQNYNPNCIDRGFSEKFNFARLVVNSTSSERRLSFLASLEQNLKGLE